MLSQILTILLLLVPCLAVPPPQDHGGGGGDVLACECSDITLLDGNSGEIDIDTTETELMDQNIHTFAGKTVGNCLTKSKGMFWCFYVSNTRYREGVQYKVMLEGIGNKENLQT